MSVQFEKTIERPFSHARKGRNGRHIKITILTGISGIEGPKPVLISHASSATELSTVNAPSAGAFLEVTTRIFVTTVRGGMTSTTSCSANMTNRFAWIRIPSEENIAPGRHPWLSTTKASRISVFIHPIVIPEERIAQSAQQYGRRYSHISIQRRPPKLPHGGRSCKVRLRHSMDIMT